MKPTAKFRDKMGWVPDDEWEALAAVAGRLRLASAVILKKLKEIAEFKAQVKRWEDKEVRRASCCVSNEELVELAWLVIANAGGGDWDSETPRWKAAAEAWREKYHRVIGVATRRGEG